MTDVTALALDAARRVARPVESKTIGKVSEVTHITRVRQGCVAIGPQLSYAGRLKVLLNTLGRARNYQHFKSPLSKLRSLHFIRWALIDQDTRLLFTSEFDHSWEKYIRQFVDNAPNLVDLIWTHTEGYEWGLASDYEGFAQWVRDHQLETAAFYAANPHSTVRDVQQYELVKRELDEFFTRLGELGPSGTDERARLAGLEALVQNLHQAYHLVGVNVKEEYFPSRGFAPEAEKEYLQIEQSFGSLRAYFAADELPRFDAALLEFLGPDWFRHRFEKSGRARPGKSGSVVPGKVEAAPRRVAAWELSQIQKNVLDAYQDLALARLLFFRVDVAEDGAEFLRRLVPELTTGERKATRHALNVGLTYSGLGSLGLSKDIQLGFPDEFRIGMARRAAALGDGGINSSEHWLPPLAHGSQTERIALEAVDVVVWLHARSLRDLEDTIELVRDAARATRVTLLGEESMARERNADGAETEPFFGFADGISQPLIEELRVDPVSPKEPDPVRLGEFVLGHAADRLPRSRLPKLDALGLGALYENGSFVAIRKLERSGPSDAALTPEPIALAMGRHADGRPLIREPNASGNNDFDYAGDALGKVCPFAAHARRVNPRLPPANPEGRMPRIVRRALPYRTQAHGTETRGMFFFAFNSSLAQQYEVLQSWINNANVAGGFSDSADPIAGTSGTHSFFTFQDAKEQLRTVRTREAARLAWGLYLFQPSRSALLDLGSLVGGAEEASTDSGVRPIGQQFTAPERAPDEAPNAPDVHRLLDDARWIERCLTEQPLAGESAAAVWRVVDACGGIAQSAYGILVSSPELVRQILERDSHEFSVNEYGKRMEQALGGRLYLGEDYGDNRPEIARRALEFFQRPDTVKRVKALAESRTAAYVARRRAAALEGDEAPSISLQPLLQAVVPGVLGDVLGARWSESDGRHVTPLAIEVGGYIFNPHFTVLEADSLLGEVTPPLAPELGKRRLDAAAAQNGIRLRALWAADDSGAQPASGPTLRDALGELATPHALATISIGAFAPTTGCFATLMKHWITDGEFARVRSRVLRREQGRLCVSEPELMRELVSALQLNPIPGVLYRRCVQTLNVGGASILAGSLVVLRQSAEPGVAEGGSWGLLFGHGIHQCPGAEMGLALMHGILAELFRLDNARPVPGRLAIGFDR